MQFHRLAQRRRHGTAGDGVLKAIDVEPIEKFGVVAVPGEALKVPLKGFEVQHFGGGFQVAHRGEFPKVLAGVELQKTLELRVHERIARFGFEAQFERPKRPIAFDGVGTRRLGRGHEESRSFLR